MYVNNQENVVNSIKQDIQSKLRERLRPTRGLADAGEFQITATDTINQNGIL